ncbi:MAG: DUF3035 domain-containing protein, partial [Alphaproteobacteria bacterium]|nr:DUF3035 domain-containing protein [Alphaproteobacteria bacterium]
MKKHVTYATLAVLAAFALTGCEDARKALTQTKAAPDEFSIYTRAPLTMPPDYGLRPPSENDPAQDKAADTQMAAKQVMLGGRAAEPRAIQASTPGTTALLSRVGAHLAEPNIRRIVDEENSAYAFEDQSVMERLLYNDPN